MSSAMMNRMRAWSSTSVRGAGGGGDFFFLFPSFGYEISSEMTENGIGRCICYMLIYYYLSCLSVITI